MWVEHAGATLHWDQAGEGTPLLLIMGHRFSSDMWYPVLPALTARHQVIWFDNRGSGRSSVTRDATIQDLAGDARAVLDAAGVGQAHVFGVSMGGGVAMQLAVESPERITSLILGCTALRSFGHEAAKPSWLRARIPRRLVRGIARKTMYGPACPPERAEHDLDVIMSIPWPAKGALAQSRATQTYTLTPDDVQHLDVPVLVQHGTEDMAVTYEQGEMIAKSFPNARLATYEGAGHNYIVACTEQVIDDLTTFLAEVDLAAGRGRLPLGPATGARPGTPS